MINEIFRQSVSCSLIEKESDGIERVDDENN